MMKLIIFDYDGLLVESESIAFIAEEKILLHYGKPLTKELFDKYLGYSVRDTLKGYIEHYSLPLTVDSFYKERERTMSSLLKTDLKLKMGAKNLLRYLKKKHIDTVIASSGERGYVENGLRNLGVEKFFKNITCVSEVKRGKPHPDLFIRALHKNSTRAEDAIVLEDAISGITAAKSAGIFCIAIPPKDMDIQGHLIADIIVDNLDKVKNLFERLELFKR